MARRCASPRLAFARARPPERGADERHDPPPRRRAPALARADAGAGRGRHEPGQRGDPRPDAIGDPADPRARRAPDRRRRQADAADADARERAAARLYRARATTSSPPRSSSSTPRPCSTTMSSTARDLRRGKRTANIIWGNPASVLVGDFLFSRSLRADGRGRQPQGAQDPVQRHRAVIAEGEVNQLTAARRIDLGEERYLDIIGAKTAALFAAACRIAAVVAERAGGRGGRARRLWPQPRHRLPAGRRRDRLCLRRRHDGQGRGRRFPRGQDDAAGDPRLCARRRGRPPLLEGRDRGPPRLATRTSPHAVELVRRTRAVDDTLARARHYGQRAIDAIGGFAGGAAKDAMVEAVEFAVARAY